MKTLAETAIDAIAALDDKDAFALDLIEGELSTLTAHWFYMDDLHKAIEIASLQGYVVYKWGVTKPDGEPFYRGYEPVTKLFPDYLNDLNACNTIVESLPSNLRYKYMLNLCRIVLHRSDPVGDTHPHLIRLDLMAAHNLILATAPQICEAYWITHKQKENT